MSLTSPRYWLKADAGRTSPVNAVTESGALAGGTVTLTEITTGVWAYRCTGASSAATFTPLTVDGDTIYNPADGNRTFAIRAAIGTMPSGSFPRLFGFCINSDLDNSGAKIARNNSDTSFLAWVPSAGTSVLVIDDALAIGTTLKTVVVRINAVSGFDTIDVWVEQIGRVGTDPDFSYPASESFSEDKMAFDRFIVQPGGGSLDLADVVLWEVSDLTNAEGAAAADDLRAALVPAGPAVTSLKRKLLLGVG